MFINTNKHMNKYLDIQKFRLTNEQQYRRTNVHIFK